MFDDVNVEVENKGGSRIRECHIVGLGGRGTNANKLKQYCTCGDNWEWRALYNGFVNYYTIY